MDDSSRLHFDPPPRRAPDRASFNIRRHILRRWLADLPLADPATAGQLLLDALTEVNRLTLSPRARWRFLEALRLAIIDSVAAQRRLFHTQAPTLSGHTQQLALCTEHLLIELGIGYCSLVNESTSRKHHAKVLQRSLHTLGCLLYHYVSIYSPPPPGLWSHLHQLFMQAEQRGSSTLQLPDPLAQRRRRSISETYKQILLLAAAGPYQMRPQVLVAASALTEGWARHAVLRRYSAKGAQGMFTIDTSGDHPPMRQGRISGSSANLYRLDTTPLVALAQRQLQPSLKWRLWRRATPTTGDTASIHLLIQKLGLPPLRQSARLPIQASVDVLFGFSQAYRGLVDSYHLHSLNTAPSQAHFSGRDTQQTSHTHDQDIWSLIYPQELLQRSTKSTEPKIKVQAAPSQHWMLLNSSAGGYCLAAVSGQQPRVQIGELLALCERGKHIAGWQIGVVRWMQQTSQGLRLGVQILGFRPQPALIKQIHERDLSEAAHHSLLLPADSVNDLPATILTRPLAFASGQRAWLKSATGEHAIQLARLLESSNGFLRFEYTVMPTNAASMVTEPESSTT